MQLTLAARVTCLVQDLVDTRVCDPTSFSWLSQLRMYWEAVHGEKGSQEEKDFSVMVRMMSAQVWPPTFLPIGP